jgi:hypothetical protein
VRVLDLNQIEEREDSGVGFCGDIAPMVAPRGNAREHKLTQCRWQIWTNDPNPSQKSDDVSMSGAAARRQVEFTRVMLAVCKTVTSPSCTNALPLNSTFAELATAAEQFSKGEGN